MRSIIYFISKIKSKLFYSRLINKNDLCFDIGANLGRKSKLFLSLKAIVIAFEPQKSCIQTLETIKNNNSNFKFFKLAVGNSNEEKELSIGSHIEIATFSKEFKNYFKTKNNYWSSKEKVKVVTLNSLIKKYGIPDYCKIDVEGYELEVLQHLTYRIPLIEFEFTGGFILNTVKIIELLNKEDANYNYNLNENPKFELSKWVNAIDMIRIIKQLPINRLHGNIFVKNK